MFDPCVHPRLGPKPVLPNHSTSRSFVAALSRRLIPTLPRRTPPARPRGGQPFPRPNTDGWNETILFTKQKLEKKSPFFQRVHAVLRWGLSRVEQY